MLELILAAWPREGAWFWATKSGAKLDPLVHRRGASAWRSSGPMPRVSPHPSQALSDVELEPLLMITPGAGDQALNERIQVVPLSEAQEVSRWVEQP